MAATMQRVKGAARVRLGARGLLDLHQSGAAKAMLPRTDDPDPEIVFLNTAGGVTGGDRLDYALHLGPRTRATGAMQTAERAYRSTGAAGKVDVSLRVGPGGHLDWLPQETILFEGCRLERETVVDLEGDATVLMADMVVLGRAAMGEVPACARLEDRRTVRRDGRLVHREHLSVAPQALADVHALAGTRALATLVLVSPGAADRLEALRAVLPAFGGASAWDSRLVARFVHGDSAELRRALIRAIVVLRGRPVPRVWQAEAPT